MTKRGGKIRKLLMKMENLFESNIIPFTIKFIVMEVRAPL